MKLLKNFFIKTHRVSGSVMSLIFFIWFFTGVVLIFKGFPHASKKDRFVHLSVFNEKDIKDLKAPPSNFIGKVELELYAGKPIYRVYSGRKFQQVYDACTLLPIDSFSEQHAIDLVSSFTGYPVKKVERVESLDQWIPWPYYKKLLPFYKCYVDNSYYTVVYVSGKSGAVIQQTTRKTRWAAYLGAIPHWVYFYRLRQNTSLWKAIIIILSSIGIMVSLSGIVVGVLRFKQRKRRLTPYKKRIYKWHHIIGLFFGLFVFTFILSGLFSVIKVPDWMVLVDKKSKEKIAWNQKLDITGHNATTPYDIFQSLNIKDGVRKIVWKTIFNKPVYFVYYSDYQIPVVYHHINGNIKKQKTYSNNDIEQKVNEFFTDKACKLTDQTEYDNYYSTSAMHYLPLPAYKLEFNDEAKTWLYINPSTGEEVKRHTKNTRFRRWVYRAGHSLDFMALKRMEWLRKTILLLLSIVGIAISITGFVLANKRIVRYTNRKNPLRYL